MTMRFTSARLAGTTTPLDALEVVAVACAVGAAYAGGVVDSERSERRVHNDEAGRCGRLANLQT